jgi:hypothetical protein
MRLAAALGFGVGMAILIAVFGLVAVAGWGFVQLRRQAAQMQAVGDVILQRLWRR